MNDFLTAETLSTFAGMAAGTAFITEAIKWLFGSIKPKLAAFAIAGIMTIILMVIPNSITAESLLLAACNWIMVAVAAAGAFDFVGKPLTNLLAKKGAANQ